MTVAKLNAQLAAIKKAHDELEEIQSALFRLPDAAKAIKELANIDPSSAICGANMKLKDYQKTIEKAMETAQIEWPDIER